MQRVMASVTVLLIASTASAQSLEIAGGIAAPLAQPGDLTYRTRFDSTYGFPQGVGGEGGQTFTCSLSARPGMWASVAWFPAPRVGIESRVRFRSAGIEGASGPYGVNVTYVSRQPPDFVPREFTAGETRAWPDADGTIRHVSFDILVAGRLGDPRRVQLRPSVGLAIVGVSGDLQPIGLTTYRLGGHAVLFPNDHRVGVEFERTWTAGLAGGLEVYRALSPRVGVAVSGRLALPGQIQAPARVTSVEGDIGELTPGEAQQALRPPPLTFRPWCLEVLGGLRVRL